MPCFFFITTISVLPWELTKCFFSTRIKVFVFDLLKKGFGSGVLATHIAQAAIDAGELQELDIDGGGPLRNTMSLIFADKANTGPAALLLAKLLKEAAKNDKSGRM